MSSPLRTVELSKRFGRVRAVEAVTLEVPDGAVLALAGPNGAGKSTLLRTALHLLPADGGRAEVMGSDARRLSPAEWARIAYVSEDLQLPDWMRTGAFLDYCRGFYPHWNADDAARLVDTYRLPLDRRLRELSRGQRMKALLVSRLAYRPSLIVLDEPFGGLDGWVRDQVIEGLLDRSPEATIVLASHDLAEVESFATHVAYMAAGRLAFVEEMNSLTSRFREVEVALERPAAWSGAWPEQWLNPEMSPSLVRFTDARFDGDRTREEICRRVAGVRDITARALPLRTIAAALARSAEGAR